MSEKFSRAARLRDEKIFRDLISAGEKISTPFFFIRHRHNPSKSPRLGIVAPKKTFRRVVDRNRLKRIARESFRRAAARLSARDILVYYLAPALNAEGVVLARCLRECWARMGK
ncbi:MAG TPA: ribonuclease P protein component [bacterium]|nr:ribonuclease P protein component [bacterium]